MENALNGDNTSTITAKLYAVVEEDSSNTSGQCQCQFYIIMLIIHFYREYSTGTEYSISNLFVIVKEKILNVKSLSRTSNDDKGSHVICVVEQIFKEIAI